MPPPEPKLQAAAATACRPLNAVFYAETDWLRLAQKLRANPSPCASYYVSIPPLAADKTKLRNGEAAKIRALGPQMHAMAEINITGWSSWVERRQRQLVRRRRRGAQADGRDRLRRHGR